MANKNRCSYFEVSNKTGDGVEDMFNKLSLQIYTKQLSKTEKVTDAADSFNTMPKTDRRKPPPQMAPQTIPNIDLMSPAMPNLHGPIPQEKKACEC